MGLISFASLVSCYASQEFWVKKDSEAQRDNLMVNLRCLPHFRVGE